jgi:hypothetical protein
MIEQIAFALLQHHDLRWQMIEQIAFALLQHHDLKWQMIEQIAFLLQQHLEQRFSQTEWSSWESNSLRHPGRRQGRRHLKHRQAS